MVNPLAGTIDDGAQQQRCVCVSNRTDGAARDNVRGHLHAIDIELHHLRACVETGHHMHPDIWVDHRCGSLHGAERRRIGEHPEYKRAGGKVEVITDLACRRVVLGHNLARCNAGRIDPGR